MTLKFARACKKLRDTATQTAWDVVTNTFVSSPFVPRPVRWLLLRALGMNVSRSAIEASGYYGSRRISIGRGTFVNRQAFLDGSDEIRIGARCQIGMQVMILTGSHEIGTPAQRGSGSVHEPVTIGDGVWVGARAMILPGVTIGNGAVIAAGAVVTRACLANVLYGGVPARPIREL